jgi:hypothetical protein
MGSQRSLIRSVSAETSGRRHQCKANAKTAVSSGNLKASVARTQGNTDVRRRCEASLKAATACDRRTTPASYK